MILSSGKLARAGRWAAALVRAPLETGANIGARRHHVISHAPTFEKNPSFAELAIGATSEKRVRLQKKNVSLWSGRLAWGGHVGIYATKGVLRQCAARNQRPAAYRR
jgi:hypothetical protein